jgi:hypothetical protein
MTQEITTLPAIVNDAFDQAPDDGARVVGEFIKFVRGGWFISNEPARINGTKLVAYDYVKCWRKWDDKRIVASIFSEPGTPFPTSAAACEAVDDGPGEWQEARYLYLSHPEDGRDFTYGTSSAGGLRAVDGLIQQIKRIRLRGKPGAYPVVELGTTSYPHKEFGTVDKPVLTVRHWVDMHGAPYPMTPVAAATQLAQRLAVKDVRTPVNDLDDDIPF